MRVRDPFLNPPPVTSLSVRFCPLFFGYSAASRVIAYPILAHPFCLGEVTHSATIVKAKPFCLLLP